MNAISTDGLKSACEKLLRSFTRKEVEEIAKKYDVLQFPLWFRRAFQNKLELPNYSLLELTRHVIDCWDDVPALEATKSSIMDPTKWKRGGFLITCNAWYWLKMQPRFAISSAVISLFLNERLILAKYGAALLVCMSLHEECIEADSAVGSVRGGALARELADVCSPVWIIEYPRIIRNSLARELSFWEHDAVSNVAE